MTDDPEKDLEAALSELEAEKRGPDQRFSRWQARAVLVPLGRLALARGPAGVRFHVERLGSATAAAPKAWRAAVQEELSLACAEHVQHTDPRFLQLKNFDWEYVLHARERLEARVTAAWLLGEEPPAVLWEQVLAADARVRAERGPR